MEVADGLGLVVVEEEEHFLAPCGHFLILAGDEA